MIRSATLTCLALLASTPAGVEQLAFAPAAGLELLTRYERDARLELTAMEMTVNGASHGGMETPELSIDLRSRHGFVDRYAEVAQGRVTRLVRSFEELSEVREESIAGHDGAEQASREAESDLEGRTVVFRWDEEDQEYSAAFEDDESEGDLLQGLQARLDLADFLPGAERAEGESWEVPASAFAALLAPGGDLKLESDEPIDGPDLRLARGLDGSIRATLRGTREESGREVAVIALEIELTAAAEKSLEDGSGQERQESDYELSGELLWLTGAGRLHALELSGEQVVRVVSRREVELGGQDFETVRTLELQGPLSLRLLAELR